MRTTRWILLLATVFALTACSTAIALTTRGTEVAEIGSDGTPPGCSLIGDVSIGVPPDAGHPGTEAELVILMRNKAGEMGGTHVLVESRERRDDGGGNFHYVGRGRAYRCGSDAARPALE